MIIIYGGGGVCMCIFELWEYMPKICKSYKQSYELRHVWYILTAANQHLINPNK